MKLKQGIATALAVLTVFTAKADLVLEDFNSTNYYTGSNYYGAYLSFEGNTIQNGNGSLVVQATDNGGFYHDQNGDILWNIAGPTNLVLTGRRMPDNQATNCIVVLRDFWARHVAYIFPMNSFATNTFTNLVKSILTPDWQETDSFDFSAIIALDVHGGFTDDDLPFALEFDSLEAVGPDAIDLRLKWLIETNTLVLKWNAPVTALLQSRTNLAADGWVNETNIVTSGFSSSFYSPLTGISRFFRLLPQTNEQMRGFAVSQGQTGYPHYSGGNKPPKSNDGPIKLDGPPGFTNSPPPVTYYTNFIDVASYVGNSTNWRTAYFSSFLYGDFQSEYALSFSAHSGGEDSFNWRDYTNQTYFSDRTNAYRWDRNDDSHNLFSWTTTWAADSTNWPAGWRIEGGSNSQRSAVAPYEAYASVPWGKLNMTTIIDPLVNGQWCGAWACAFKGRVSRADETHVHLHTGLNFANYDYKYVLISSYASSVDSLSVGLNDSFTPDFGSVVGISTTTPLSWSNITVLGKSLNADGRVLIKAAPAATTDATPTITGTANYTFDVTIVEHLIQNLSRLYHPLFDVPPFTVPVPKLKDLQDHFNNGTDFLAEDNDAKISDDDPLAATSTDTNSVYITDDVPTYVEFQLTNGPISTNVLTRRTGPVFPPAYKSAEFFRVRSNASASALLAMGDATIKIVKTLQHNGVVVEGLAPIGTSSIILLHTLPGVSGPHEWGHTRGLYHRGTASNPGPIANAMMNPQNFSNGNKVNRSERATLAPP